ncbi:uncharacterized protein ACA1_334080 [Acanthamoeba castellanii str. Neff]|uniref:Uncharacterized protein n=1 Tax=Acanthamoeba castellanii (strain ATCC 30010 / Neff) TaxID=1257118 RepID=L8GMQ8_ACACF|nr:uncharacterized protein ACA1_334080 [Acanthamoeba castellanii str. Neff]ELR14360.1 hypothetical protein ACA1_334080 [Acanthamoeba castellanii str. Neff]
MGCLYMVLNNMENFLKHYQLGLDTEKRQLPMFLPYMSLNQDGLTFAINLHSQITSASTSWCPT